MAWAASRLARVRAWLALPAATRRLALVSVVLLAPSLWVGLVLDDYFQRLAVEGRLAFSVGALDLFGFLPRGGIERSIAKEMGNAPWWMPASAQVDYFRPLASLTHFADYKLWPHAAWLMHAENLGLYAVMVLACGAIYRRFIAVPWVAGLATALYAFDHAHALPVGWIANRNALMAMAFGLGSLLAHDTWRRERKASRAVLAVAAFALALLSAESGLAMFAYLVAYAWTMDRGAPRSRVLSVLPYAAVAVAWRLAYRALGYGVVGSAMVADPIVDPVGFVRRAATSVPLLVASDVFAAPTDALAMFPRAVPAMALFAAASIVLFAFVAWPAVRGDRTARFFAAGSLLAALPFGAMMQSDRYVFCIGVGLMGLLAQLCMVLQATTFETPQRRLARWMCVSSLVLHAGVSPAIMPVRSLTPFMMQDGERRVAANLPSGPDAPRQTAVVVNAPSDLITAPLSFVRAGMGGPIPAHIYLLSCGTAETVMTRVGPREIDVRAPAGWLPNETDRAMRDTPFRQGEVVVLAGMRAEVREVLPDGRASLVRFTFPADLEDPSLVFLSYGRRGLEPFEPPAERGSVIVPIPPVVLDLEGSSWPGMSNLVALD